MAEFVFKLPDVGEGTVEAEIAAWYVDVGERVEEDQPLVDVMTDKATVQIGSPVAGTVTSIHARPGDKAAVGSALVSFNISAAQAPGPSAQAPGQLESRVPPRDEPEP